MAQVKDLEYLGEATWGYTNYYWNAADSKYYYTKGIRDANEGSTQEAFPVTDESQLGKLKKKYNRGGEGGFTDYNPFLEQVSTIKTTFGNYGPQLNGFGGSVRYPHDMLIDEGEDFVMFDFYDYKPPFQNRTRNDKNVLNETLEQYNASAYAGEYFKAKNYPQILLYMPQDVQDGFSAKWQGKKFGALTTGMLAAAGADGIEKIDELSKSVGESIGRGTVNSAAAIVSGLAEKITGDQISANDLFTGISGVARNPNVEVLFQSMQLRNFDLTFKMAPYDESDVQRVDAIIKIFKQAMLPQYTLAEGTEVFAQKNKSLQAGFIQVPKVCAVNFMRGSQRNRYLPRYKMCAITDVNVNYTPDNVYATFNGMGPVATELKISFMETKLVFSEDVKERGF